jgi:hypothetical protein
MKISFRTACVALFVFVVAAAPAAADPAPQEVEALIAQADSVRLAAAEAGAEWLKTESLIEEARQLAAEGDWQAASARALKALRQGQLALEQAEREAGAWRERVIR